MDTKFAFGKTYKTRDGRKAICVNGIDVIEGLAYFAVEGYTTNHNVIYVSGDKETTFLTPLIETELRGDGDIVSDWREPISESELIDLSCANFPCDGETDARSYHKGFKDGYHEGVQTGYYNEIR